MAKFENGRLHPLAGLGARSAPILISALLLAGCGQAASVPGTAPPTGQSEPSPTDNGSPASAGGTQLASFHRVFAQPQISDGKPLTFFLGGQFCPFCASMRWPLVRALERFGTFTGLGEMHSKGGTDGFASIATYDFAHSTYRSDLVTFQTVEAADANGNPLQQPNGEQNALINRFDPNGSIPFVFIAGEDVAQVPYSPGLFVRKSFSEIKAAIENPAPSEIGRAVGAEADAMTAVICKSGGGRPAEVCGAAAIQALIQQAP